MLGLVKNKLFKKLAFAVCHTNQTEKMCQIFEGIGSVQFVQFPWTKYNWMSNLALAACVTRRCKTHNYTQNEEVELAVLWKK